MAVTGATKVRAKRPGRVASAPVAALATIPAGPRLALALAALDFTALTGFDMPLVVKARYRQGNHERAQLLETVFEVMRRKDPEFGADDYGTDQVGMHELRAALAMTRKAANTLCALALDLKLRLPAVLAGMHEGLLDQPRARIFSVWTQTLAEAHARAVVARLLPVAPRMTTAELIDAIQKAAIELDPEWARRRYERAVSQRLVRGQLSEDGTGHLHGEGLPADDVAAACDRLDAMAWYLKRHGHPGKLDHIRADIYIGLLNGAYAGLSDDELLDYLLAAVPAPESAPEHGPAQGRSDDRRREGEGPSGDGPADLGTDSTPPGAGGVGSNPKPRPDLPSGGGQNGSPVDEPVDRNTPNPAGASTPAPDAARLRVKGLRLSVGLATIAGLDSRPGELLGWGMLHADLARRVCAAAAASWWYALTDREGNPLQVGPIRARPTSQLSRPSAGRYRAIEVWLQFTREEIDRLIHAPPQGWARLLADLARQLSRGAGGPPNGDPRDRLPSAPLRRWLHVRDRRCVFPGCRIAPHRCDADHSIEYAKGGLTADANLANACGTDHALRHEGGWTVAQPTPGRVVWISKLGHHYERVAPPGPAHAYDPMPVPTRPADDWGAPWPDDGQETGDEGAVPSVERDRDWSLVSCLRWWPKPSTQPESTAETEADTEPQPPTATTAVSEKSPERVPEDDPPPF